MTRSALRMEECCSWCRRPVSRCKEASCDDARTYNGVLLRGEWREVHEDEQSSALVRSAA